MARQDGCGCGCMPEGKMEGKTRKSGTRTAKPKTSKRKAK